MAGLEEEARRRLAAIPGFDGEAANARLKRLPGLTNRVYRVACSQGRFALRIPGEHTAAIIDRRTEETNARVAASIGVAPEVIHFGADGVMLTRFIGAEPLSAERIVERRGALERVGSALKRLHDTAPTFKGRFDAFATIDAYAATLERHGRWLTPREKEILDEAQPIRAALEASSGVLKPCHCDTTGGNLLDTGERVWLVDWEYSGMNDPLWDTAYCSVQCRLSGDADATLLSATLGRKPVKAETARMAVLKAPVELMSALWALVQNAHGNRAADFSRDAEQTFEQSAERMAAPEFQGQLELVREG